MDELIVTSEKPAVPVAEDWDCDRAIKRCRTLITGFRRCAVDLLHELYVARELLSAQGARSTAPSEGNTYAEVNTWTQFCQRIGIRRQTANRWLRRYDPVQRKKLPPPFRRELVLPPEKRRAQLVGELDRLQSLRRELQDMHTAHVGEVDDDICRVMRELTGVGE